MIYRLKKILFFLLAILSIVFLMYWMLYDLYHCVDSVQNILFSLDLNSQFDSDIIIGYSLEGAVILNFTALIYLIFYRKEFCLWPKLLILFTGTINIITSSTLSSKVFLVSRIDALLWNILLCIYAAIALAAIIWLIVAMVKYQKPKAKTI